MNREIKFRAYDKEVEKMTYFDDEDYLYNYPFILRQEQVFKKDSNYDDYEDFEYKDITNKVELMQYTGLHDKNGKEIYEGDIVLYQDWEMAYEGGGNDSFINKGIVEYCEDNCCFNVTERQTVDLADVLYKDNEDLEVIGNIYDNPELLGGK